MKDTDDVSGAYFLAKLHRLKLLPTGNRGLVDLGFYVNGSYRRATVGPVPAVNVHPII